jgi:hypothetical protein
MPNAITCGKACRVWLQAKSTKGGNEVEDTAKKKKTWALIITGIFALISVTTFAYNDYYIYLSAYLWFGFIYGMCLQYGRFCFASAFRDLFAVGVPRMVVGIMIATLFFAIVSSFVTAGSFSPPPRESIRPGRFSGHGLGRLRFRLCTKLGKRRAAGRPSISVTHRAADVGGGS